MAGRFTLPQAALALVIALFLCVFLVVPVFTVIYVAFTSNGSFTLSHFESFFHLTLMREAFYNSLYVGGMSVVVSSILALPLAYFITRFQFKGALLIQTLGVLPLIMPPFVGATAMQLLFGRSGSLNLILGDSGGLYARQLCDGVPRLAVHVVEFAALLRHRRRARRPDRHGHHPVLQF